MARSPLRDTLGRSSRPAGATRARRGGIIQFFGEAITELRKAVWPSREEVMRLTYIVIIISAIMGFLLGALDVSLTQSFTRFVIR